MQQQPPPEGIFDEAERACERVLAENVILLEQRPHAGRPLRPGRRGPGVPIRVRIDPELASELRDSHIDKVALLEHAIVAIRKMRAGAPATAVTAELARCLDAGMRSVV